MSDRAESGAAIPRVRRLFDQAYLLLCLAVLFWSGNFVIGRAVAETVPPVALAFSRWLVAGLILLPFAWPHLRRDGPALRRRWQAVLALAALGIAAFNTLVYVGLHSTTAINGLMVQSTMPVLIVLTSFLIYRERVTLVQAVGITVSLAGAVTIVARGDPGVLATLTVTPGDLWILAAVTAYAVYSVLLRERPAVHPLSLLAVLFLLGALMLAPFLAAEVWAGHVMRVDAATLAAIGYVALFPSIASFFCFNRGVELIGANRAGVFIHLMPVFGSLLAITLLGERFQVFHAAGMALILGGIVLTERGRRR